MSETFTFTGDARQIRQNEFVLSAAGKTLAPTGTVVISSEGGAVVAFVSRDGFIATFGRDPIEEYVAPKPVAMPKPAPVPEPPAPPARKKAPAKAKK